MPVTPWQLQPTLWSNAGEHTAKGVFTKMINCYRDEFGNIVKRPGLVSFALLDPLASSAPVDGAYWWKEQGVFIAVCQGKIYSVTEDGTPTDITGKALQVSGTVSFASAGDMLYMVNGGKIVRWSGSGQTEYEPNSPANCSSIVWYDEYLIVTIPGTQRCEYGILPAGEEDYEFSGNYFTAASRPDDLLGIKTGWREIVVFSKDSVEFFYNDGETPFSRVGNLLLDTGCGSLNSAVRTEDRWFFLDNKRNIVALNGRTPEVISNQIAKDLWELTTVADCYGSYMKFMGLPFLIFSFPTDKKTFVYDLRFQAWYEWSSVWTTASGYDPRNFFGVQAVYAEAWNKVIFTDSTDRVLYYIDADTYTDGGAPIIMTLRTAPINHGTSSIKRCKRVTLNLTRGEETADMTFLVRFRDDGDRAWKVDYLQTQGALGDFNQFQFLPSLGQYRNRQWELIHSAAGPITILSVEEDVEVLPNS